MELYYVMTVVDRQNRLKAEALYHENGARLISVSLARGTAKTEHLSMYDLNPSEKAIITGILNAAESKALFSAARNRLYIDIPGNGIVMALPLKSVAGGKLLDYLGEKKGGAPKMEFSHELIVVILNDGHADTVMDAARSSGAGGGTVLHAKGTGAVGNAKFLNVSLADEKDIIYIVAEASEKAEIMRAVAEKAGAGTAAGAICFSLPISSVIGLREKEKE